MDQRALVGLLEEAWRHLAVANEGLHLDEHYEWMVSNHVRNNAGSIEGYGRTQRIVLTCIKAENTAMR